ncbi:MAG: NDP-sugar synthase [Acidobacteria bacterium]|nr:MAG: NDP-sugar synthase [Acidobacteriota bacterium]REK01939.1 MAG: NDP-sugar synthase [Acidobacteriota bacterium]REK14895.1 MAG: NDP-sugar synthase [Acidobacteriota bacterium]REK45610.1 MAG: NDP-sugar synthase [Acidobacteriota bacterium]
MRALILAGGKGTRLRPLTVYTPKPIVPVLNRPFLEYQIEILKRADIHDITLSLNYQPDKIQQILGYGEDLGVKIDYVTEPQPMGTAGAYKYAANDFEEPTIVVNGDILTDLIISRLIKHHQRSGAKATIALAPVEDPKRYGLVKTDGDGNVEEFLEKPDAEALGTAGTSLINAGIYVLEKDILELIPEAENYSFEYNVFPAILEKKIPFSSYAMEREYWCDIGTPKTYLKAHMDFLEGRIKNFPIERDAAHDRATSTYVDETSVIDQDCVIKPNVKISNSVIGRGVVIEEKAVIENSVIWPHSRISNSAKVSGAILARSCYVGKNAVIGPGAVLGNKTTLTDYTRV